MSKAKEVEEVIQNSKENSKCPFFIPGRKPCYPNKIQKKIASVAQQILFNLVLVVLAQNSKENSKCVGSRQKCEKVLYERLEASNKIQKKIASRRL